MKSLTLTTSAFAVVIALAILARTATSDEIDEAIQDVILSQIEAFANDDKDAAWTFASEGIKRQSGSVDTFYNMVRLSYRPVYQATSIEFMERVPHTGFQIQIVRLGGPEGKHWRAVYRMVKSDEQWRISGVLLKEAPRSI